MKTVGIIENNSLIQMKDQEKRTRLQQVGHRANSEMVDIN